MSTDLASQRIMDGSSWADFCLVQRTIRCLLWSHQLCYDVTRWCRRTGSVMGQPRKECVPPLS